VTVPSQVRANKSLTLIQVGRPTAQAPEFV
jgi:hypothetical protein